MLFAARVQLREYSLSMPVEKAEAKGRGREATLG